MALKSKDVDAIFYLFYKQLISIYSFPSLTDLN